MMECLPSFLEVIIMTVICTHMTPSTHGSPNIIQTSKHSPAFPGWETKVLYAQLELGLAPWLMSLLISSNSPSPISAS